MYKIYTFASTDDNPSWSNERIQFDAEVRQFRLCPRASTLPQFDRMVKLWKDRRFGNIPKKFVYASVLVSADDLKEISEAVLGLSQAGAVSDAPKYVSLSPNEGGVFLVPGQTLVQTQVGSARAEGHIVSTVRLFDYIERLRDLLSTPTFKASKVKTTKARAKVFTSNLPITVEPITGESPTLDNNKE